MTAVRLPLRVRWTALLVAFGLVPLATLAFITLKLQREGLSRAEKELELAVVEQATALLDGELRRSAEATRHVGVLLADGRIDRDDVRLELAHAAVARDHLLEHAAVYDADGKLIDAIRRVEGASEGPPATIDPRAAPPRGVADVRWVEPIGPRDQVRGWVVGKMSRAAIDDVVRTLSEARFGAPDRILVVDGELAVIAGGRHGAHLAGKDIFVNLRAENASFAQSFAVTAEFRGDDGAPMVGTLQSLPSRGWAVAVRRPEAEAFGALVATRRSFAGAAALVAAVALALGALTARRATRPIEALGALAAAYGRRAFQERSPVRTGDEIEGLGHSLETMADSLAASDKEIARRAAVEAGLSRFLPEDVARAIARGEADLSLGGQRRVITVVFADAASFTTFAEGAPPERVVAFLNELFGVLSEVTFRHRGVVDKFIGDCLMAVFGSTEAGDGDGAHAREALAAAEDMHRFVEANAPAWKETYGVEAKLGIGVATGEAVVGNLGTQTRMEYTAIGDAVNVAARLEALALPGQTLVTRSTAEAAGDTFETRSLGEKPLRGKRHAVEILEVVT